MILDERHRECSFYRDRVAFNTSSLVLVKRRVVHISETWVVFVMQQDELPDASGIDPPNHQPLSEDPPLHLVFPVGSPADEPVLVEPTINPIHAHINMLWLLISMEAYY